jgi:hypothetical protein
VKLRGRTEAPDGAEGAQFLSARGAKPQAHHGPLKRLLDVAVALSLMFGTQSILSQRYMASTPTPKENTATPA